MKRVRIHYCGGCNPRYDRTALVQRLNADFPSLAFTYDGDADLVLAVCGCSVACAAKQETGSCIASTGPEDEDTLRAALNALAERREP